MQSKKVISIGVDIGGSHISCAVCDMAKKEFIAESFRESPLNNKGSAEEIISIWGMTLDQTMSQVGKENIAGIGFAMPGPFEYDKGIARMTIANDKYENIYGLDVPKALRAYIELDEDFPIRFINDATAFALGEDWLGKARGSKSSLSITLGTGFGSAFLKNGIPVVEGNNVPLNGCVWHLPFEEGIGDDYFSTRGFLKRYEMLSGQQAKGVKELATMAPTDKLARSIFEDFGYKLGSFLYPWIYASEVEVLVLGGNISKAFSFFEQSLKQVFTEIKYPLRIEKSELMETASIIGSSVLVDDSFFERVKPLLHLM